MMCFGRLNVTDVFWSGSLGRQLALFGSSVAVHVLCVTTTGMYDIHDHRTEKNNCRVVHYCCRPPLFGGGRVYVNKKTERYLFNGTNEPLLNRKLSAVKTKDLDAQNKTLDCSS